MAPVSVEIGPRWKNEDKSPVKLQRFPIRRNLSVQFDYRKLTHQGLDNQFSRNRLIRTWTRSSGRSGFCALQHLELRVPIFELRINRVSVVAGGCGTLTSSPGRVLLTAIQPPTGFRGEQEALGTLPKTESNEKPIPLRRRETRAAISCGQESLLIADKRRRPCRIAGVS